LKAQKILLATVVALAVGVAQQPPTPSVDRNAFTFTAYDLQITIDPAQSSLTSRGKITLRNDSKQPQVRAALQISSSLQWTIVNGQKVASRRLESDIDHTGAVNEAVVEFAQAVAPGQSTAIEVGYSGTIKQDTTRLTRIGTPAKIAANNDWDRIAPEFTGVRGVGYVAWYPVAIEPALLGDGKKVFDRLGEWKQRHAESMAKVQLTVQRTDGVKFQIVPTGLPNRSLQESISRADIQTLNLEFRRAGVNPPMIVIGDYQSVEFEHGRIWRYPYAAEIAKRYIAAVHVTPPFVGNSENRAVLLVQLPDGHTTYESGEWLYLPLVNAEGRELAQHLIHSITHAAFYSKRSWIYEGLAHYGQARLIEEQAGRKAAVQFLEQRRGALALSDPDEPLSNANSLINTSDEVFYRSKAMFVWWMLRDLLGEATFRRALGNYRAEMDRDPAYVQGLLEKESKRDLQAFFNDWVYRDRGLPDFRVTAAFPRRSLKGGYLVSVTVENLGNAGAEVPVFISAKETENNERVWVAAKSKASVRIELPILPTEARVNDGSVPESDPMNNTFAVTQAAEPKTP
jgi:hypothetical protein